jgi:hypothetical protein
VKAPLTLGFGTPAPTAAQRLKPLLLRLPPDKLLYLLLRWQSLPQNLPHVGHTDVPVPDGIAVSSRAVRSDRTNFDGDVESVRSWVGTIRSVSTPIQQGFGGWWGKPKEIEEGEWTALMLVANCESEGLRGDVDMDATCEAERESSRACRQGPRSTDHGSGAADRDHGLRTVVATSLASICVTSPTAPRY